MTMMDGRWWIADGGRWMMDDRRCVRWIDDEKVRWMMGVDSRS